MVLLLLEVVEVLVVLIDVDEVEGADNVVLDDEQVQHHKEHIEVIELVILDDEDDEHDELVVIEVVRYDEMDDYDFYLVQNERINAMLDEEDDLVAVLLEFDAIEVEVEGLGMVYKNEPMPQLAEVEDEVLVGVADVEVVEVVES